MNPTHPVDVVAQHPRVVPLGRTAAEQRRVESFAIDLARWLHGEPRETLGPLARVVVVVAHRELRDPRILCRNRPLLSVEAAARATEAMWPLLRGPLEPEAVSGSESKDQGGAAGSSGSEGDGSEGDEEAGGAEAEAAGGGGGTGEPRAAGDEEGDEEGDERAEGDETEETEGEDSQGDGAESDAGEARGDEPDPTEAALSALADLPELSDPELEAFAKRLRDTLGGETDTTDLGAAAGEALAPAAQAALDGALETDQVSRRLEHFLPGVGWSFAPGQLHTTLLDRLDKLADLLGRLDHLEELAEALGRMEGTEGKGGLDMGGSEEVVGVHVGGEVAHTLPSELALLGDPLTEDLFYQRFVDRRLIALELEGAGLEGSGLGDKRGPIIACIDTSGSMEGSPEMAAKALVLAVCRRALPQGRVVHLILFSGRDDRVELRLRRGAGGLEALIEFLALTFRGGTDFDAPLMRAMELLDEQELSNADVLVVTDGLARASPDMVDAVQAARERHGVRVWSVVLGQNDPFGVRPFSDEVWRFDPHEAAQASGLLGRFDY